MTSRESDADASARSATNLEFLEDATFWAPLPCQECRARSSRSGSTITMEQLARVSSI